MKKLSNEEIKDIYKIDLSHRWKDIISDDQLNHPNFKSYRRQKKRLQRLIKYIQFKRNFDVAEFGSGNGLWGDLIHEKVNSYVGVDFSESFINLAKRRHRSLNIYNSQFYCNDIVEFSKENKNKYDQAFSMDFSEHVYDEEFVSIFSSMKNTLKEGGKLYIHTPNGNYLLELFKKWGILKQSKGHIGIRNDLEHINLLKKIGFKSVKVQYLPHYIGLLSFFHFISFLPGIGKYFKARLFIECTK